MLLVVGRYFDPWEAHILRARLEAEGIPASVAGDQHVIAYWPMSVALGGVALQVPDGYFEQARQIVADYHSGDLERELVEACPEAEERCPACDAAQVAGRVPLRQRVLALAAFLLAFMPLPTQALRRHCRACGHRWWY
jgi:hypothetical protein